MAMAFMPPGRPCSALPPASRRRAGGTSDADEAGRWLRTDGWSGDGTLVVPRTGPISPHLPNEDLVHNVVQRLTSMAMTRDGEAAADLGSSSYPSGFTGR